MAIFAQPSRQSQVLIIGIMRRIALIEIFALSVGQQEFYNLKEA
jgi:hypothetical protein